MNGYGLPEAQRGREQRPSPANFSEAIDRIGLGPFQTRLMFMCGMGWIIDSMETLVVAFVLEKVAISFELSSVGKGLVGSASFLGMLLGAGFWSIYADKRGRRTAFVQSLACVFVGGVFSAASPSFGLLCLCRMVVGFGVGGNLPVTTTLLTEFLPTKDRANVLCRIAGICWGIGSISASLIGLLLANIFGPGEEEAMWRWFLGLAAVPAAMVAVAYHLLPESPRFLQVMGRHEEAMQVLEHVARMNGKLDVLGLDFAGQMDGEGDTARLRLGLSPDAPAGLNSSNGFALSGAAHGEEAENAEAGDVRELFHTPILRRVTLCIWMVWLTLNISYFGMAILLPRYYGDISGHEANFVYILSALVGATNIPAIWLISSNHQLAIARQALSNDTSRLWREIVTTAHLEPLLRREYMETCRTATFCWKCWAMHPSAALPTTLCTSLYELLQKGAFAAMWLCSEHRLGRVGTLKWSSLAAAVVFLLLATTLRVKAIFSVTSIFALFVLAIPETVKYVLTPELYSTKYRAVGLGSASVVTRVGGLLAPVLAELLYDGWGPAGPLFVFGPILAIAGVAAGMIPVETAGQQLDDDSWDRK